jgi:hypothetical protein
VEEIIFDSVQDAHMPLWKFSIDEYESSVKGAAALTRCLASRLLLLEMHMPLWKFPLTSMILVSKAQPP